jgi:hypothetical protein
MWRMSACGLVGCQLWPAGRRERERERVGCVGWVTSQKPEILAQYNIYMCVYLIYTWFFDKIVGYSWNTRHQYWLRPCLELHGPYGLVLVCVHVGPRMSMWLVLHLPLTQVNVLSYTEFALKTLCWKTLVGQNTTKEKNSAIFDHVDHADQVTFASIWWGCIWLDLVKLIFCVNYMCFSIAVEK